MDAMDLDSGDEDQDTVSEDEDSYIADFLAEQQRLNNDVMAAGAAVVMMAAATAMDEDSSTEGTRGGSAPGKSANKKRDFKKAYEDLVDQYFSGPRSVYNDVDFERRFMMPRSLFSEIYESMKKEELFAQKSCTVTKKLGIRPLVRLCACLRHISTGEPYDSLDDKYQMSESELRRTFLPFCRLMKKNFGPRYLNRQPTDDELQRILTINAARGFPGLFASWDCKHFSWSACPRAWSGQFKGKESGNTIVLEAICCPDLYIWQHYFGDPGSLNDINILDKSTIVESFLRGDFRLRLPPHLHYKINDTVRDWLYFLVDGIYPDWSVFISTIAQAEPRTPEALFAAFQEAMRKDIERAFGVLVKKFGILQRPIRVHSHEDICAILDCCIIIHNMLVELKRETYVAQAYYERPEDFIAATNDLGDEDDLTKASLFGVDEETTEDHPDSGALLAAKVDEDLKSTEEHNNLLHDLIQHINDRRPHG